MLSAKSLFFRLPLPSSIYIIDEFDSLELDKMNENEPSECSNT